MTEYDAEAYEAKALSGDWRAQVTVLTRSSIKPDVLSGIIGQPDLHQEVQLALIDRRDCSPEILDWVASRTSSAVVLNRIVMTDRTDVETVKAIRDSAEKLDEPRWRYLVEHADRVLKRREESGT